MVRSVIRAEALPYSMRSYDASYSAQSGFRFPVVTARSNFASDFPIYADEELDIIIPEWDLLP
jgi:hypothetical protein